MSTYVTESGISGCRQLADVDEGLVGNDLPAASKPLSGAPKRLGSPLYRCRRVARYQPVLTVRRVQPA